MQALTWEGRVVSCNKRLAPGRTKNGKTGRFRNTDAYRVFRDGMTWDFIRQRVHTFTAPDVMIYMEVGPDIDHHNLTKPILDALQNAKVIDNDKNVQWLKVAPAERHAAGVTDRILIILRGK